jgi:HAD superfamily hydrolase (TIGR01509 family)
MAFVQSTAQQTPMPWSAVLWDVDGTLAETERDGHRVAFNQAFAEAGLGWHWNAQQYGEWLSVTGGRERLLAYMAQRDDAPTDAAQRDQLASRLHGRKNALYALRVAQGEVKARSGVLDLMQALASAGVLQGIVTTTSRVNVQALLHALLGPDWRARFALVLCGEDCQRKKPDPEIYQSALTQLGLPGQQVLAIEDARAGVLAARGAGLRVLWRPGEYDLGTLPADPQVRVLPADAGLDIGCLADWPA